MLASCPLESRGSVRERAVSSGASTPLPSPSPFLPEPRSQGLGDPEEVPRGESRAFVLGLHTKAHTKTSCKCAPLTSLLLKFQIIKFQINK